MREPGHRTREWPTGSLLASLSAGTCAELLTLGTLCDFEPERVLLREGDRSTHVILLLAGCVKVTAATSGGRVALLDIRVGGELIGELASLDDQPRSATVTTVGRVRARTAAQPAFHDFLTRHPDASVAVSRGVSAKLRWATRRRIDFTGCEVRVRLARVLVELAATYGHQTRDGLVIGVSLTQPELAALVGAAEPTVHKALAELRRKQVIGTGYRRATIRDYPQLRRMAGLGAVSPAP